MKELEDYDWFPPILRRFQTEFIGDMVAWTRIYQPIVPLVRKACNNHAVHQIVDLCTGNARPILFIAHQLSPRQRILLTDKYPNPPAQTIVSPHEIIFEATSYDILTAPFEKNRLYTMFNAFHHFDAATQISILQQLQQSGSPFIIVEILQPNPFEFVKILLTTTLGQLLVVPFIKPFSWLRLLLTYLIPINLLTVTIDGIISVFKSKKITYYEQICVAAQLNDYQLNVTKINTYLFTNLTVIQGQTRDASTT